MRLSLVVMATTFPASLTRIIGDGCSENEGKRNLRTGRKQSQVQGSSRTEGFLVFECIFDRHISATNRVFSGWWKALEILLTEGRLLHLRQYPFLMRITGFSGKQSEYHGSNLTTLGCVLLTYHKWSSIQSNVIYDNAHTVPGTCQSLGKKEE